MSSSGIQAQGQHVALLPLAPQDPTGDLCPNWKSGPRNLAWLKTLQDTEEHLADGTLICAKLSEANTITYATAQWRTEHLVEVKEWNLYLEKKAEAEAANADNAWCLAEEEAACQKDLEDKEAEEAKAWHVAEEESVAEQVHTAALKKQLKCDARRREIPAGTAPAACNSHAPIPTVSESLKRFRGVPLAMFMPNYIKAQALCRATGTWEEANYTGTMTHADGLTVTATAPKDVPGNETLLWNNVTAVLAALSKTLRATGEYSKSVWESITVMSHTLNSNTKYWGNLGNRVNV
jgi:hypothetical protein